MSGGRIVLGILGLDAHETGAMAVASILRDAGLEVIYVGRFQTPETLLRAAAQEDADLIGISCHSWEYTEYLPALMARIKQEGADISVVAGGSVITPADAAWLTGLGVAAVFRAGADADEIASTTRRLAQERRQRLDLALPNAEAGSKPGA
jgi:methylmalonyl-CoA mutase C-terminal domain/subunit